AWQRGSVAAWQRGSVAAWQRGSVAAWQRGSVAAWQRGSVARLNSSYPTDKPLAALSPQQVPMFWRCIFYAIICSDDEAD
ncbi:hypothetical protein, partial [Carnimonas bestiolae]|uniref:hypothetical protein n=1 Tax=Carnimonas bestiolae TaxID=3402172 RepID=UPI003F4ADF3B